MAGNNVRLDIIVDDDGTLRAVGNEAQAAAEQTEKLGKSTEKTTGKKRQYNKVEKGVGQLTANTTKAFSKQQGVIAGGIVPAYAVLASNVFALTAAFNFLKNAFDVQALESSQIAYASNTGVALGTLTDRLRQASDGMLGFREAGQAAAVGLAKGFSPKQLEDLAKGARKASTALGRDFQDSFDRLVRGASKAEPELLDELGITLRLETATNKYAEAIGKNRDELNEYERSQAVLIETQRQLNENFGDVDAISNPFIKLQKTFEDLVKSITGAVMPVMTTFVEIINRSTGAAVAVFGLLGLNIAKSMLPFDEFKGKLDGFFDKSVEGFSRTKNELIGFGRGIKEVNAEIRISREGAVKSAARSALAGGADSSSKILQKMKKGMDLTPQEKGRIKRSIKEAEAQYKQFGAVTTGMFKGVNIAIVRDVGGALKQAQLGAVSTGRTFGRVFKGIRLGAKLTGKALVLGLKAPLVAIGKTAQFTGKMVGKAMRLAGFIGTFLIIKELVMEIIQSPFTIVMAVAKGVDKVLSFMEKPLNSAARGILSIADFAVDSYNSMAFGIKSAFFNVASAVLGSVDDIINGVSDGIKEFVNTLNLFLPEDKRLEFAGFKSELAAGLGAAPVREELSTMAKDFDGLSITSGKFFQEFALGLDIVQGFKAREEEAEKIKKSAEALERFKETSAGMAESIAAIDAGLQKSENAAERGMSIANAIRTLEISSAFKAITATRTALDKDGNTIRESIMTDDDQQKALQNLKKELEGIVSISPDLAAAFETALADPNNTEALELLERAANASSGQIKVFEAGLSDFKNTLSKSMGSGSFRDVLNNLNKLDQQADAITGGLDTINGKASEAGQAVQDQFSAALGDGAGTMEEFKAQLESLIERQEQAELMTAAFAETTGSLGAALKLNNELTNKSIEIAGVQLQISKLQDGTAKQELQRKLQLLKVEEELLKAKKIAAAFDTLGTTSGSATTKFAGQVTANQKRIAAARDQEIAALKQTKEFALLNEEQKQQAIQEIKDRYAQAAQSALLQQGFDGFKAFAEDLRALGPEGELMAATSQAIGDLGSSMLAFQEVMADGSAMDKAKAGLAVVGAALNGYSQIAKASSQARIRAIDEEIAAEKKRDGKSAESQAKIKELEKKKVAEQRKAFEQDKKMKMAQTVINTATAAMTAYTTFAAFPPLAAAMAAMVVAMGMKQLQMISSTSFSGGGSMGGGGPTAISAGKRTTSVDVARSQGARGELAYFRGEQGTGGPENFKSAFGGYKNRAEGGNTAYMVGEQGPELFVPDRPGNIVANDDIAESAPTNVSFNINTIDASGVEDMLVAQRGNIIGMIRQAANSYGQDFVESVDTSVFTPTQRGAVARY